MYSYALITSFLICLDDQYEILIGFSFAVYRALPLYLHIIVLARRLKTVIILIIFSVFQSAIPISSFFFLMNSSFSAVFSFISSRVTDNSQIVLHSNMDNSFSPLKAAITVFSNSYEKFGINLNKPCFFDDKNFILKL